jgi:uncharacterized integral membrane protein (TIGR00698 family)
LILLSLSSYISAATALFLGIIFALTVGNPYLELTRKFTQRLLQLSVIGLGAGMNLAVIGHEGLHGFGYTAIGIIITFVLGLAAGKFLKTGPNISLLTTVGTAICGGSAIAAVAPIIGAKSHEISVALATVFILNAAALFIFPAVGHYLNLSQTQFGLWSALAIHDTSSVVGSALQYGSRAVEIATTVKLARALWIIPVALVIGLIWSRKTEVNKTSTGKYSWFILGFLLAATLVTFFPGLQAAGIFVSSFAKKLLVLTLFLIGSTFIRTTFKTVGIKPFLQGVFLWVMMSSMTLGAILLSWIN